MSLFLQVYVAAEAPPENVATCRWPAHVNKNMAFVIVTQAKRLHFYADEPDHTAAWTDAMKDVARIRLPFYESFTLDHLADAEPDLGWSAIVEASRNVGDEIYYRVRSTSKAMAEKEKANKHG